MKQAIPDLARRPDIKALFALYDEQPRAPGCPSPGQLCPEQHEAELTLFCRQHGETFLADLLRGGLSLDDLPHAMKVCAPEDKLSFLGRSLRGSSGGGPSPTRPVNAGRRPIAGMRLQLDDEADGQQGRLCSPCCVPSLPPPYRLR
jgi:hypothetical protein